LEVPNGHIRRYVTETITIRNQPDPVFQGKHTMLTTNFLAVPIVIVPLLVILLSCGGNIMLTIFVVLALIPLGYIFAKFF
jgi:hypothetical protein